MPWTKRRPRDFDYWRRRERSWRRQHIEAAPGRAFNRYDYARAWRRQAGRCGLCHKAFQNFTLMTVTTNLVAGIGRGISVDHQHHDRRFRALVHGRCNHLINGNTVESTRNILAYLRRFQ